jgi:hypothetical protein
VVCSVFVVVGVLLFMGGIREWRIESASVDWPMLQADITRSEIVKAFPVLRRSSIEFAQDVRKVSIRYVVNGRDYNNDFELPAKATNMSARNPGLGLSSSAKNTEHISIYYDPGDPREVVLHPGDKSAAVSGISVGGMLTIIFSMTIFMLVLKLFRPHANG